METHEPFLNKIVCLLECNNPNCLIHTRDHLQMYIFPPVKLDSYAYLYCNPMLPLSIIRSSCFKMNDTSSMKPHL